MSLSLALLQAASERIFSVSGVFRATILPKLAEEVLQKQRFVKASAARPTKEQFLQNEARRRGLRLPAIFLEAKERV